MACAASFDQILGLLLGVALLLPVRAVGLAPVASSGGFDGLPRGISARYKASVPDDSPVGCWPGSSETQSDLELDC